MKTILGDDEIIVHIISTETSPESVYPLGIELMPEVAIELLSPVEVIENIRQPIVLIDSGIWIIRYLIEL